MSSRIYPQTDTSNLYTSFTITQVDIIQIKITRSFEVITRLIEKIINKHCE